MNDALSALKLARERLEAAEHMLSVTYNLVGEPRLLFTIVQKLHDAYFNAMKSILYYERYNNKIPKFEENFESMQTLFEARCARRYNHQDNYAPLVKELHDIVQGHKQSPVVFARKGSYVICDEEYGDVKQLSQEMLQRYARIGRLFIEDAERMVLKHGTSFT